MNFHRKWPSLAGLLLCAFLFTGCPEYPDVSPSEGYNKAPIDTVINIAFATNSPLNDEEINSENIRIMEGSCAVEPSKDTAETKPKDGTDKKSDTTPKKTEAKSVAGGTSTSRPVEGEFLIRSTTGKTPAGDTLHIKDISFMPKVPAEAKSLLKPDQDYCVDIEPLTKENGDQTAPATINFHTADKTKKEGRVTFEKKPFATIKNESSTLSPKGVIWVEFSGPVNPSRLTATNLCTALPSNATVDPEKPRTCSGSVASSSIYQIEQLKRDSVTGLVQARSRQFAIISTGTLQSPASDDENSSGTDEEHFTAGSDYKLMLKLKPIVAKAGQTDQSAKDVSVPTTQGDKKFTVDPADHTNFEDMLADMGLNPDFTHLLQVK